MTSSKDFFILHANCIPVSGVQRSLLCDLHLGRMKLIPNELVPILEKCKATPFLKLLQEFQPDVRHNIEESIAFLYENDWGDYYDCPPAITPPNLEYQSPYIIDNAILCWSKANEARLREILLQLDQVGCRHLEMRSLEAIGRGQLSALVQMLDHTGLVSVSIILPFHDDLDSIDFFLGLIHDQARIHGFRIYDAPQEERRAFHPDARYTGIVHFTPQPLEGHQACGVVDPKQFTSNIRTFSESLTHNTCLNQKVSILENGAIKNCPSTPEVIGNIRTMTLVEAVKTPDLQKRWRIPKDQIADCKVCEFRRVCTDCRAFVKVPGDLYSKPAKCRYNPYTATWDEGSFAV